MSRIRRAGLSRLRVLVAAAAGLLVVTVPLSTAHAQMRTVADPVGDTTPANDIVAVKFSENGRRIRAVATYRDLGPGHLGASLRVDPGALGGVAYELMRAQGFDGKWRSSVWRTRGNTVVAPVRCPGRRVHADSRADTITFLLPQACLGRFFTTKSRWLQIRGGMQEGGGVALEKAPNRPVKVHPAS